MKRLAIVTTHPIQYYAPIFKLLQQRRRIDIMVFYTWGEAAVNKHDPGFGKQINWDIPLLEDYPYQWAQNTAQSPGSHHFKGIVNPGLVEQINLWKPDAILVFGWGYHSHLKVIRCFKNKVPIFFRGDSTLLDEKKGVKSLLKSVFLKWVYSHVNHAFYAGVNNKAYFKKYGLKDSQLTFAPHAVDNERFAVERTNEALHLRNELKLRGDDLVILFAGKLEEKKDSLLLLKAFLNITQPGVHLVFAGNGALENRLKDAAKDKGNVHFINFQNQSQMPVILQGCDIFCLPSKGPQETWGLAVNEAMACGKAVLVSDKVGCAADLVKNSENGYIFNAGNIEDLKTKLVLLVDDKDKVKAFGEASRRIIKDWNFTNIAQAIENKLLNEAH
jgi:glycosyltransferase involved in cell wall biosynthesis